MQNAGVMQLLRPLLLDNVPSIQQSAALALGRLANYSDDLAEAVVGNEILPQLVYSLSEQNRFYKKAAAFVLRAVAKHSPGEFSFSFAFAVATPNHKSQRLNSLTKPSPLEYVCSNHLPFITFIF